jgi:outer membrane protein
MRVHRWLTAVLASLLAAVPAAAQDADGSVVAGQATLTLEQAVGLALQHNRDLETARLGLDEARGQVREAWGSVMPKVDASASYTRNLSVPSNFLPRVIFDPDAAPDELVAVKFGADNVWSFNLRAEQPLFQAAAFLGVGAADQYESVQTEEVRGRSAEIATRVRISYYDVLLADEAARLSDNTARRIRQSLEETQAMQRAGIASDYDVLRLQVELANVEPNERRARDAAAAARRSLAIELGVETLDSVDVVGTLAEFDFTKPVAAAASSLHLVSAGDPTALVEQQAIDLAMANRSDVRQAALMERLRHTEVRVEQSEYLPKVSLFANYAINAQHNGDLAFFGGDDQFRSYGRAVGIEVSMPVFSGFERPARLQQREATLEQARTARELLTDRVEHEVKTLLAQVREAESRGAAQQLARQQAQRGYEIARAEYREGLSSPLELTDAEVALRQSEFNYAQAVYDYLAARARLDEALGVSAVVQADGAVALTLESTEQ